MRQKSPAANNSLLQPASMEDRARYINRFASHGGMSSLFNDEAQRREVAAQVFQDRWDRAMVTVKKLDGEMFFID